MGLNDFYSALDQQTSDDTQRKQAEAVYNLNNSYKVNPDEEAEKRRLEQSTGIPATLMTDPQVKESAKQQYYMQGLAISHTPSVANFAANANNAPLMKDDIPTLAAFEGAFAKMRAPKSTLQFGTAEDQAWASDAKKALSKRTAFGTAQDISVTALKGAVGLPQAFVGLADIPTFGLAGKSLESLGVKFKGTQKILGGWYSEAQQEANKDVEGADGFIGSAQALLENPSVIAASIGESLPQMLGGAGIARKILGAGAKYTLASDMVGPQKMGILTRALGSELAPLIAGAIGEGAITAGGQAEQSRADSPSGLLNLRQVLSAMGAGAGTGVLSVVGGKVAQKLGIADVDTMLAGGESKAVNQTIASKVIKGAVAEGLLEEFPQSMQEQMWQNYADGKPVFEGVPKAGVLGLLTGMVMGGGGNVIDSIMEQHHENQVNSMLDALTTAEMSKLKERSPETFAQFAQNTAEHYGAPTIYFQAYKLITAAINNGVTEQQLPAYLEQYGVSASHLQEAINTGGLIGLETGKFATYYQNDPVLQSLQNDFVIDPNAHSRSEAENGVQLDMETMKHLNELYQADQNHKINQDDIAAWEEAILNQPGLKGKVTTDSLMPVIARANVLAQLTGVPAIEHLNRLLRPTGLQAVKFADYEARKQNKAANAKYDFDTVYDSLADEGDKTVVKGKSSSGNWSESEFSKHLEQFYPAVHSLYLMHGHNKSQILAALKNAKEGKQLNDNHAAIIQAFKDDMDNYAEQQAEEDDYPFQQDRVLAEKATTPLAEGVTEIVVDGVTRPALNSNGKPIHWSEEGVRNFWRWFGDSKVVDEQGRPLVVYHGTGSKFTKINMKKGAQGLFWFASDKDSILSGDAGAQSTKIIMELYAKIESPANWKQYDQLMLDEFKGRGLDGAVLVDSDGSFNGFVMRPEQIKSATGNSGAFDPSNPNILLQSSPISTGNETFSIRRTAEEGMLAPAVLKDGKVLAAGIGATHYDVHTEVGQAEGREDANGFVAPDGTFLDRKESLQWLKENRPDVYRALDKETKQNGLESQAYAHAEGLGGDLADEAQRYMESLGLFQTSPFDGKEVATTPLAEGVTEIVVDGVTRPALNSNGKPIHWSEEGIRNFWRWFGDSKVVDEQGRPLVVYHGSPDARFMKEDATFRNRWSGDTKGAHWFTPSRQAAATYADPRRAFDYQGAEPSVVEAYIKAETPSIVEAGGANWRDAQRRGKTADVINEAQNSGNDSVIIKNVKDDYNNNSKTKATDTYVVFDSTQIKSATGNSGAFGKDEPSILYQSAHRDTEAFKPAMGNKGTYSLDSNDILKQGGNNPLGALNTANGVNIVSLFEGADKSTFLHETAHIFLNDLRYVAETYGVQQKELAAVNEWIKNDPQSLRQHAILIARDAISKVDAQTAELIKQEIATLEAMPVEQVQYEAFTNRWLAVAGHEKFAEHFEKYLMEGKAPSIELRNAFRSFKRWLTKIYEGIKSYRKGQRDNVTATPELADLFGRLMATEQQIQAAREHDALVGMLDANMMADVGDSQSMIDEYRKLLAQSDDSAREKMDKHKLVGSEQRKTEFRKQAQEEVKAIPVYAFVDKVVAEGGINRQSVEAILGKENTPNLPHLWRNDGLDVNVAVAEHGAEHGFNSAGELAAALQQMEPRQLWVDKRVAQLEAIHDTTLDSQEAIRTAALRRMLEIESEWLAKRAVKQTVTPRAVMRAWADKTIAGRTMREINNVGKLLAESRKHRQQAILEARKGKWDEALAFNEKARLTEELIAASYRAIKTNKAIESNVNKVKNATRVKSGKAAKVGESWRKQIDRLLDQYGIAKRDYDPAMSTLHDFAASKIDDFDGTGAALPAWIGVEVNDFNKLTFEQRQEFNDTLKYLYGNGRDEVRGRKLANGEAVADKAAEIAARQDGIKNKKALASDATAAGRVIQAVQKNYRKFFANTGILRFIAKRMDGYSKEMGPAEQLVQDIINGMAESNDMWVAIQKEVEPALQILMKDGDKVFSDITWPELLRNEGASWNKARVVAAALNMGNDSNMMKLLDGYGLTQDDASVIASKLTAEEWQAIQKIWDTVDSLWPQIADVHERLRYFRPKDKIKARELVVTTADNQTITLKGGYYPIKYDVRLTRKIAEWSEKDDLLASHEAILQVPKEKSGFLIGRTNSAYPVDLSLNVLATHFNDTIRFITLAEKVRDADRVFRNDILMERNLETLGRDMVDMIRPTLKQVIRPEASKVSPWFERSRVAMSMYYMGYNAWTAIQNTSGVLPAIRRAGLNNYMNGIMHVMTNPLAAHKAMLEASGYMRLRSANAERDMKKQLREFNIGGMEINGKRYTYDDVKSLGFAGIRLVDSVVALPAWWGKYNAEMEQHGDVKKATEAADAAINSALGSGLAIDSTGFQRHPFLSLFVPFMSFSATQQENLQVGWEAWRNGKISSSEFLYENLMTWLAPAIMSTFLQGMLMYGIAGALGGGDDDKKKKDWSDYIGDLISYRLMGIPFLRDVYNGIKQGFDNKAPVTSARMPVTEGFKMVQQLGYRVGNLDGSEKKTKAAMWSAAELASLASGVPATRIYDRWQKGTKQIENGSGWWGNHFVPQEKKK